MRRSVRYGLQALILLTLLAASIAWIRADKTVTVSVDGSPRQLRTLASTVGGLLDRADIAVGEHDQVAPGREAPVRDGAQISVRRGRQLALTVDGQPERVWVTASSVAEALDQLGIRADGAYLSASRSREIPLGGFDLALRTPHRVSLTTDGSTRDMVSTAATVADLLTEAGVALEPSDRVSEPADAYPADGAALRVTRVRTSQLVESAEVPFGTVTHEDAGLARGTQRMESPGTPGTLERTYAVTLTDGVETAREPVAERLVTPPQDRVVTVGTQAAPPAPTQSSGSASVAPAAPQPSGGGGLNWAALAQCESSGNPRAASGPYQGLYQFDQSTWASVGGTGRPADASPAEQLARAQMLYQQRGRAPWPVCGRHL